MDKVRAFALVLVGEDETPALQELQRVLEEPGLDLVRFCAAVQALTPQGRLILAATLARDDSKTARRLAAGIAKNAARELERAP